MFHPTQYTFSLGQRVVEGMTRDEACRVMRSTVTRMARGICGHTGQAGSLSVEDLEAYGMEGLIRAFDRFEPARGTTFQTYARIRVRGAMADALRSQDTMSRYGRRLARHVEHASREVARENGGTARPSQVADRLGLDLDGYWRVSRDVQAQRVLSLDAPIDGGDDPDSPCLVDTISDDRFGRADRGIQRAQAAALVREAIAGLPDRYRECVVLHYERGTAQTEIAKEMGITVSRVSQILAAARDKLRLALVASVDAEDLD